MMNVSTHILLTSQIILYVFYLGDGNGEPEMCKVPSYLHVLFIVLQSLIMMVSTVFSATPLTRAWTMSRNRIHQLHASKHCTVSCRACRTACITTVCYGTHVMWIIHSYILILCESLGTWMPEHWYVDINIVHDICHILHVKCFEHFFKPYINVYVNN